MIDIVTIKLTYTVSLLITTMLASITVDTHLKASRTLRLIGFLGIPLAFITSGLLKLEDYQVLLTLITGIVAVGISLHSEGYYKVAYGLARYFQVIVDLTLASLILLFSSTFFIELIVYWLFLDIIVAFIALTMEHGTENLPVAATYIAMCIAPSDLALLTMWAALVSKVGLYESFLLPLNTSPAEPLTLDPILSAVIMFGFAIKLGQFPLHSWPPTVYGRAPTHISAILSGVVSKMGIYAYFISTQLFVINPVAFYIALIQGLVSTIYGAFSAVLQSDVKRILAYSSISYGGVIVVLYATLALLGLTTLRILVLAVVAFHALTKALAFINAGLIYQLTNTYDVFKLGYLFYISREASISAFTVLLNLTGLPPSLGFIVKLLLIAAGLVIAQVSLLGLVVAIIFVLSAVLSIMYGIKFMSTYISTLPRSIPRVIPIPKVELNAEMYLSVVSLVAPALFLFHAGTLILSSTMVIIIALVYSITLLVYIYAFRQVYIRARTPEEVKYWLSGVEL